MWLPGIFRLAGISLCEGGGRIAVAVLSNQEGHDLHAPVMCLGEGEEEDQSRDEWTVPRETGELGQRNMKSLIELTGGK